MNLSALDQRLLNDWQRDFPLVARPFDALAATLGLSADEVLARLARLQAAGAFSRIGGVWAPGVGGAALLCAYALPPEQLEAAAQRVNALPGVNHNYEREDRYNLWFVITGADAPSLQTQLDTLDAELGLCCLRLPMRRPYRIDLGFDLQQRLAPRGGCSRKAPPVLGRDRALAAWLEDGLPLVHRPYDLAAIRTGRPLASVLNQLQQWQMEGTLKRLGVIVRHHELGFDQNAMAVFDAPDEQVDALGQRLAAQTGVTLAYRRERAADWPYNLYAMVHGRERAEVQAAVDSARHAAGLDGLPHKLLFSRRRFKQQGGRYFSAEAPHG
ncbi:DNA-binding Lrp family transcriptional regulator [Inhella inkyongensis]|uniref:siroheme decarboxylase n=1 Tax=Inhella inkyongensis TaxID=392593 RepID=A0A840S8E0_9BURK|nr:AsnC family transcriptional regulator [Inhella inkyongensis]MBB5204700.1 DNA-binding Lrp family transcriptional regulator [Inhella inkyongensis]